MAKVKLGSISKSAEVSLTKDTVIKSSGKSMLSLLKEVANKEKRNTKVSTQDRIHYEKMYKSGLCKLDETHYNKTIQFFDINYQLAHQEDKITIFNNYCGFINYFEPSVEVQMTFVNEYANIDEQKKLINIKLRDDNINDLRKEYRDYLQDQLSKGNNGLVRKKYITFTIQAKNEKIARSKLERIETDVINNFKIMGVQSYSLNGMERLELLHNILNKGSKIAFPKFDWDEQITKKGIDTKDYIAPMFLDFRDKEYYRIGNDKLVCFQQMLIEAPQIEDRFLAELLDMECEMVVTINFQSIDQQVALKYVKKKIGALDAMKSEEQKKAVQEGYDMDLLSPELKSNTKGANDLFNDLSGNNERYFAVSVFVTNFANSMRKLQDDIFQAISIVQKANCQLNVYENAGERALNCMLPIGYNDIYTKRGLTTSSLAIFVPFTTQELFQDGNAVYYGLNPLTNNMIMADRKKLKNPNGLFMGEPGTGKSFSAKREISHVLLTTNDDIFINDPEAEYGTSPDRPDEANFVKNWGGQEIILSGSSKTYINPLDINENYALDEDDPVFAKIDNILAQMELIIGEKGSLSPIEKSTLDRCARKIYSAWRVNPVEENIPILGDLYQALLAENNEVSKRLADGLDLYVNGSLSFFNHHTNVEINNRLVSFNTRDLGTSLRKYAMLIIEDQIWNRVSANRNMGGKYTWVYFDEFHLFFKDTQTAMFSVEIWKRLRKWKGIPTGITQNVKDLLNSKEVSSILDLTSFYYLLSQGSGDRALLADALQISNAQLSYIDNSGEGEGLLKYDKIMIPFSDKFPKDTKLYRMMTTKASEI